VQQAGKLTKHTAVAKDEAAEKRASSLAPVGRNSVRKAGHAPKKGNPG